MTNGDIMAGIDLGSKYVRCVVAEVAKDSEPEILGVGKAPARGINKGARVNRAEACASIEEAVQKAEDMANLKIKRVYIAIDGGYILKKCPHGAVTITSSDKIITENDLRKVKDSARILVKSADHYIIQLIPLRYTVDGNTGTKNPVGLSGTKLELDTMIVQIMNTCGQNITTAIEDAGLELEDDGLVLSTWSTGYFLQDEKLKEIGTIFIDIGYETTKIALYIEGDIVYCRIYLLGGNDIDDAITKEFGILPDEAERLKTTKGAVLCGEIPEQDDDPEIIEAKSISSSEPIARISKTDLDRVIRKRLDKTFSRILRDLGDLKSSAGVILLSGGVSQLSGIGEYIKELFGRPVKICRDGKRQEGIPKDWATSEYATAVSAILYGAEKKGNKAADKPLSNSPVKNWLDQAVEWLHEIF